MAKFQLVTDISQWGFLRWPAQTRRRLVISTVALTALAALHSFWNAYYIMEVSASVLLNILLITANLFIVLSAAYLQAVLIGDLFFAGPWRERVFLGNRPRGAQTVDLTAVDDHSAEFIALVIIAGFINIFALNIMTGDFFGRYHQEGFFQVQMRHDDPERRVAAMMKIADPLHGTLWEREGLRDLIVEGFEDEAPQVRQRAVWAAGILEILRARPALQEIARHDKAPAVRAEAAFTLGRLGPDLASRQLLEELLSEDHPGEVRIGALRGLAQMKDIRAVDAVMALLDDEDDQVVAHAFWVLARLGSKKPRDMVREIVEQAPHGLRRCAALEAFKLVATPEDATWARRQFQNTPREERCEALTFEEPDERIHYVIWGESVRVKWLKTVGNTDPYAHRNWLKLIVADPQEEEFVREIAAEIQGLMDR